MTTNTTMILENFFNKPKREALMNQLWFNFA